VNAIQKELSSTDSLVRKTGTHTGDLVAVLSDTTGLPCLIRAQVSF